MVARRLALTLPAAAMLSLLSGCTGVLQPRMPQAEKQRISDAPPAPSLQPTSNVIVAAVEKVGPAVVRIDTVKRTLNPLGGLFGRGPSIQQQQGQGSGFITRSDGILLTNAHVVDGASQVGVTLPDGRSFSGKVLGADPLTDVAVVKVVATGLPVAPLGTPTRCGLANGRSRSATPSDWTTPSPQGSSAPSSAPMRSGKANGCPTCRRMRPSILATVGGP